MVWNLYSSSLREALGRWKRAGAWKPFLDNRRFFSFAVSFCKCLEQAQDQPPSPPFYHLESRKNNFPILSPCSNVMSDDCKTADRKNKGSWISIVWGFDKNLSADYSQINRSRAIMIDCPWFFSITSCDWPWKHTVILISSSTIRKIKKNNFVTQSLVFYGFNTVYTFLLKILFF